MPEIDEKSKMQKITRLLELGGTMLATSHECGAPMFRYQGKVLCPVCDVGEAPRETEKGTGMVKHEAIKRPIQKEIPAPVGQYDTIATITKNKIQSIAESLDSETDLQRVKDKLECMELGIRILKLLE